MRRDHPDKAVDSDPAPRPWRSCARIACPSSAASPLSHKRLHPLQDARRIPTGTERIRNDPAQKRLSNRQPVLATAVPENDFGCLLAPHIPTRVMSPGFRADIVIGTDDKAGRRGLPMQATASSSRFARCSRGPSNQPPGRLTLRRYRLSQCLSWCHGLRPERVIEREASRLHFLPAIEFPSCPASIFHV